MQWAQMTRGQQGVARRARGELATHGVEVTVSQVARYLDEVMDWLRGGLTLAALCAVADWAAPERPTASDGRGHDAPAAEQAPEAADPLAGVRAALAARVQANQALRAAMLAAKHSGVSANGIAAALDGHVSRPTVLKILGERSVGDQATNALTVAGFVPVIDFDVHVAGGKTVLELDFAVDGVPYSTRRNSANAAIDALRQAGLAVWAEGTFDVSDHLAEGRGAEVHASRP